MRKLSEVIVRSGVLVYREIIHVAAFSIISTVLLVPAVFFLSVPLALLLLPLVYAPAVTGVVYACHRVLSGKKPKARDVLSGAWKHWGSSAVFGYVSALFGVILFSSWWYYGGKGGMFHLGLAIFQTYFVAMFFVSQIYTLPLLVREEQGIFRSMGRSAKLFMARPAYTAGAFVQLVSLGALLLLTVIGFAFLFPGMAGFYLNLVTSNLLDRSEDEGTKSGKPDEGTGREPGWTLQHGNA